MASDLVAELDFALSLADAADAYMFPYLSNTHIRSYCS
jgi:hypothetical protein